MSHTVPSAPRAAEPALHHAFSDAAAAELRGRWNDRDREQIAASRDMTPGAPHPDPGLAAKGWQASGHGTYMRRPPQAQAEAAG